MRKYRLTYFGMAGYDYKEFDTQQEAIDFVEEHTKHSLITPIKLYKYDSQKDVYVAYIEFKKVS